MRLRLGGASADGAPADEVGDVLRRDRIEKLGGSGQTEVEDIAEEAATEAEAGGGYTWGRNSRLNQLTAWSNDPVADPPSEWFLLQDCGSREAWRRPCPGSRG
mgnify:CR=1 FL=1